MTAIQIALLLVGCFVGLQFVFYFVATGVVIKKLMAPKKRDNAMLIEYETREKKFQKAWLDIPFRPMRRQSPYGYTLHARLYMNETPTDKFVLLLHGHNNSSIGQLKYLGLFRSLGYNVLIPDHRRSGDSEGRSISFGCFEKHDVIGWIDVLQKEFSNATFGLFGESMGAATATMVAAMDKRIRFLIEYCGFADFKSLTASYLKNETLYRFLSFGLWLNAKLMYGVDLRETNALSAMASLTIPVLIMHSKADKIVSVVNAYAFAKANPNAEVKLFEDSIHARSIVKYPEEYSKTVADFIREVENK